MGDGMPDITVVESESEKQTRLNRICSVCAKRGCCPLNHIDEVLSDEDALRYAKVCLEDQGLGTGRLHMLARYIVNRLSGKDARDE